MMSDRAGDTHEVETDEDAQLPARVARVRASFWEKLARVISRVPFADDLVAAYYCMIDPLTPARPKALIAGALAYFILPTDAVPDFVIGLGLTDDAAVLATVIATVRSHILDRHRDAAQRALARMRGSGASTE